MWLNDAVGVSRREFLSGMVTTAGGLLVGSTLVSCGGGGGGAVVTPPPLLGEVSGVVLDLQNVPQPGLGNLILMSGDGRQTGARAAPDANGHFHFKSLTPGTYQIRFDGADQAIIPEPFPHPIRFQVEAGKVTDVPVHIQRGNFRQNLIEIYLGDDFFQLQPNGSENGEAVIKVGTVVCWYNVGNKLHTITGGPWVDSGDMQKTQAYLWTANQVGVFPYFCKYHRPAMQATLRVTA
jgi:hypothetical protein